MNKWEKRIVESLRYGLKYKQSVTIGYDKVHIPMNAIEENEQLKSENTQLKAERDKAVEDLNGLCWFCNKSKPFNKTRLLTCEHMNKRNVIASAGRQKCDEFEWRGLEETE